MHVFFPPSWLKSLMACTLLCAPNTLCIIVQPILHVPPWSHPYYMFLHPPCTTPYCMFPLSHTLIICSSTPHVQPHIACFPLVTPLLYVPPSPMYKPLSNVPPCPHLYLIPHIHIIITGSSSPHLYPPCANPYNLLTLIPTNTPMYKASSNGTYSTTYKHLSHVPPCPHLYPHVQTLSNVPPTYSTTCTNPYHMFLATHVYDAVTFLAYVDHLQMFTQSNVGVQQEVPSVYRLRRREARKLETS